MSSKHYWRGRDDFDYLGYPSPPLCNRDSQLAYSVECRREQRDYEDGFRAAEREAEEAKAAKRLRETRQREEAMWLEDERARQEERELENEQQETP